ncbi:hypothetical protein ABAC460_03080 [Asticcacaulis sp. AC460]|uniref:S8 family serine peptidase n=1 Tax=Asticcacaulis sp. AC460 TaxID=1282360 RepID=UPI0003C3B1C7|nr:S8 family serine peptidase [Asticcacaulis sp. AC460]ESQ92493.1 hypothetical protein ABAC460_03080 [Asticcacaulis sp. AC460]
MLKPTEGQAVGAKPNAAQPGDDPLLYRQWYIDKSGLPNVAVDLNVRPVWDGGGGQAYTGAGVHIGIFDSLVESDHPDLAANYDASKQLEGLNYTYTVSGHGTAVAGIIAAGKNGIGVTGIAYGATITSAPVIFSNSVIQEAFGIALTHARDFDVVNMSLGGTSPFDTYETRSWFTAYSALYKDAADNGRGGLGTVLVNGAGNNRDYYWLDANLSNFQNQRYNITVGAVGQDGFAAEYTSEGANVLVVAPSKSSYYGHWVTTTDKVGIYGYNDGYNTSWDPVSLDYTTRFGGTSASTPMISAIVALMLEANPDLGWRDVRDILTFTARQTGSQVGEVATYFERYAWKVNASDTVNGTGLHFNQNYGFGLVDALAAVRLAESWTKSRTSSDEVSRAATITQEVAIPQDATTLEFSFEIAAGMTAQTIRLYVDLTARLSREIQIKLISPSGTESLIIDRQGSPLSIYGTGGTEWTPWTFTSNNFVGEDATGTWRMTILDTGGLQMESTFHSATLTVYGDQTSPDSDYIYTNEFGVLAGMNYGYTISDMSGIDTLNAAAVTAASVLDLRGAAPSSINGKTVTIAPGTVIENAWGGDGGDAIYGNGVANSLNGMRGNDTITGGSGNDTITGNSGDDYINGGNGSDEMHGGAGIDKLSYGDATGGVAVDLRLTVTQNTLGSGLDKISGFENLEGSDFGDRLTGTSGSNIISGRGGHDDIHGLAGNDKLYGGNGNDTVTGDQGDDLITGGAGGDVLWAGDGNDTLSYADATAGVTVDLQYPAWDIVYQNQTASGGDAEGDLLRGFEHVTGGWGHDSLTGNEYVNLLIGAAGNDTIVAMDGDDTVMGGAGGDRMSGGYGIDLLSYVGAVAGVRINLNVDLSTFKQSASAGEAQGDVIDGFENVLGGNGNDTVTGDYLDNRLGGAGGDDVLIGDYGQDVLDGYAGNDVLSGGEGDDKLYGRDGDDNLAGGWGNDTVDGGAGNDTASGGYGNDQVSGGDGNDVIGGREDNDILDCGAGNDTGFGGDGDDRTYGRDGNDYLVGENGNDTLDGGVGADTLSGGDGEDRLSGGGGADRIYGYGGNDVFVFGAADLGASDMIMDFLVRADPSDAYDRLDLRGIDAVAGGLDDAFSFIGDAAFSAAGQLRVWFDGVNTRVQGNTVADAEGVVEFEVLLAGNLSTTIGVLDFFL